MPGEVLQACLGGDLRAVFNSYVFSEFFLNSNAVKTVSEGGRPLQTVQPTGSHRLIGAAISEYCSISLKLTLQFTDW